MIKQRWSIGQSCPLFLFRSKTHVVKWLLDPEEPRHKNDQPRWEERAKATIPRSHFVVFHRTQTYVFRAVYPGALYDHRHADSRQLLHSSRKWRAYRSVCHHSLGCECVLAGYNWSAAWAVRHSTVDWRVLYCNHVWNRVGAGRYRPRTDGSPRYIQAAQIVDILNR